ncbi:2-phosphosulfolactate phosphatase XcbC [Methylomagnum sp.]
MPIDADTATRALEVGARLERGPSARLIQTAFRRELADQLPLFDAMGRVDLAHTLVMLEAGIIPPEPGRELLAALLELRERPGDFQPDPARGDLYTNREAWLAERTAAVGWLGAGRARREATTTAFHIKVREDLLHLADALAAFGHTLTRRARQFRDALMPDYTYLQAAQPTRFGHYLLGFAYPILRDLARLRALYGRINRSPAGCGSTNGSRLPQDRERLAELLGFEWLAVHARDAMWQADLPIETAAVLTAILVNLDRLAEDLQIFSTEEFGLVELDDGHARASKIMPQKKNPFALTHIRGLANAMLGTLTASAVAGRTPSGQPDNRLALYGSMPRAVADTRDTVDLMAEVVDLLRFDEARGRARLADGTALATDLAEVLVLECGLDFRRAHRLVGHLVRQGLAAGDGLHRLTPEALAATAEAVLGQRIELAGPKLRAALDPEAAIAARTGPGGAAPDAMAAMLDECGRGFAEGGAWADGCRGRLEMAEKSLSRAVEAYPSV